MNAEKVMVYGQSGGGKSHSMNGLDPERTLIVNVCGKRFPFQNKFKYVLNSRDIATIKSQLKKMPSNIKTVVIDDFGYVLTDMFMRGHSSGDQFKLYNSIGDTVYDFMNFLQMELPEDVIVYLIMHEEETDTGKIKLRTIGKLIDRHVCLEGMVTICLHCVATSDGQHLFRTQSDGLDLSKSPAGMFDSIEIPNDLAAVDKRIREFWGIKDLPAKEQPTPAAPSQGKAQVTTTDKVPTPGKPAA